MPAVTTPVFSTPSRPDTPTPKKVDEITVHSTQRCYATQPRHRPDPLFPPPSPYAAMLPIQFKIVTDSDSDTESMVQSEDEKDEYTLSGYGDISLSRVIISPSQSPTSTSPNASLLQSRFPLPNLRLKVQRPPMPKRRSCFRYFRDPLPYSGGLDPEDRWPDSPRPIAKNQRWNRHHLVSPPLSYRSAELSNVKGKRASREQQS
ncbi:hypothetical protein JVU11DRAFT_7495 [Chiua virens]|nr:hypothetical protein JVU11DRAFT_7495 [Chiua virens]